jgi:histone-lysine N-methyltransferase SETD3
MNNHAESAIINSSAPSALSELVDSDDLKMRRFLRWMEEQGATFPSMTMKVGQGTRQVQSTRALLPGELVLHVPRKLMLTPAVARASETGRLIAQHGCSDFGDYEYLAAFLLEIKRDGGFWKPYIDVLPQDYSDNPLFFSETEMEHLEGSYIDPTVRERREWDGRLYDQLPACLKENGFTREAFTWARCAVISRVYGVTLGGRSTVAMVPLADMFDHAPTNYVRWIGEAETGFIVTAEQPVAAGAPLFERYGRRCNAMLLNVYGFCLEGNPDNEAEIQLEALTPGDRFYQDARLLGKTSKDAKIQAFKVQWQYGNAMRELLSYLRLSVYDEPSRLDMEMDDPDSLRPASDQPPRIEAEEKKAGGVAPISRANEVAAVSALIAACEHRLQQFPTSIEEDEALLKDPALLRNVRNMVMVRRDEKIILRHFLELRQTVLPLLRDESCDLAHYAIGATPFAAYFLDLVNSFEKRGVAASAT